MQGAPLAKFTKSGVVRHSKIDCPMTAMGLGRVKTLAGVARVEYHRAILHHDSLNHAARGCSLAATENWIFYIFFM